MQTRALVLAIAPVVVSTFCTFCAPAAAAANRFALTCFENRTDLTLRYQTRWGNDGQWSSTTIAPGERRWHSWRYERPNQNRSPVLHVRFDGDLTARMYKQAYSLKSYAAPQEGDCKSYGKEYVFRYDGTSRKYIDLKERR
jgi:hypothetical protein